ncbi:hypothetical protein V1517DRAFT_341687 [Lipomyces orientalis]|uniref:Uncharacterized protein n=1 Tax=Lipomyces orientalis TaxID=1233043 RepID=A0ACC3TE73_9ASCO
MQLSISVDNPVASAGSPLSGIVALELQKETTIGGIKVRFRGISLTTAVKHTVPVGARDISQTRFKVKEWHLHVDITTLLFVGQQGRALPAGKHRFPYIINVPVFSRCDCITRLEEYRNKSQHWTCTAATSRAVGTTPLPPSLKADHDRYVRYRIIAVLERPGKLALNMSKVKNIIVVPVTFIHAFDPFRNDQTSLMRKVKDAIFTVKCKKLPDSYFQEGSLQRPKRSTRSLVTFGSNGTYVGVPTQLEVILFNDGNAPIMEPLNVEIYVHIQVDDISRIDGILNVRLSSMRIELRSVTSGMTTEFEGPLSVIKQTLFRANALGIPLIAESVSGPPKFRLNSHLFSNLDISKIVPGFQLLNLHYHHQLAVTVELSFNNSSSKAIECVCPITVVSGVDFDLDTQRLMPPRYNVGEVQFEVDDRIDDNDRFFDL